MAIWEDSKQLDKELKKAEKRVKQNWVFWQPVMYGVLTYSEACNCDMDTLLEANVVANLQKASGRS